MNLIKKGIVFFNKKNTLTLSPAYWLDIKEGIEIENMRISIVIKLHSKLKKNNWNHGDFQEELSNVARNIQHLQYFLYDRLDALCKKRNPSRDELREQIDTEDLLYYTENVLLFAQIKAAHKNRDKAIFADTLRLCDLLLNRHRGIDKELQKVWEKFREECARYVV